MRNNMQTDCLLGCFRTDRDVTLGEILMFIAEEMCFLNQVVLCRRKYKCLLAEFIALQRRTNRAPRVAESTYGRPYWINTGRQSTVVHVNDLGCRKNNLYRVRNELKSNLIQ